MSHISQGDAVQLFSPGVKRPFSCHPLVIRCLQVRKSVPAAEDEIKCSSSKLPQLEVPRTSWSKWSFQMTTATLETSGQARPAKKLPCPNLEQINAHCFKPQSFGEGCCYSATDNWHTSWTEVCQRLPNNYVIAKCGYTSPSSWPGQWFQFFINTEIYLC